MISFCSFNSLRTFVIPQVSTHADYVHVISRVIHAEPAGQCIIPVFSPSSLIDKVTWCIPIWVTLEVCFILTLYEDMSFFSLQLSGSECPHRGLHSYCVISFGLLFPSFLLHLKRDRVQLKPKCRHLMHVADYRQLPGETCGSDVSAIVTPSGWLITHQVSKGWQLVKVFFNVRNVCFRLNLVFTAIDNLWTTNSRCLSSETTGQLLLLHTYFALFLPPRHQFCLQMQKSLQEPTVSNGHFACMAAAISWVTKTLQTPNNELLCSGPLMWTKASS